MQVELAVLGGGRMGEALVGGLLAKGWAEPPAIAVVERLPARREALAARWPEVVVTGELPDADAAVIAVKPGDARAACETLTTGGVRRVLSIAAGVTTAALGGWLGDGPAILRAMPNTPALVGAAASALAAGPGAADDDLAWAEGILSAVGTVTVVSEGLLDAVTGLSGSGPAYVFLLAEALVDAGVLVGLPRPVATGLTVQTLLGSARLLAESGESPEALRAAVTSPGGTTAAGLRALEAAALRAAIADAVVAARDRAAELGAG